MSAAMEILCRIEMPWEEEHLADALLEISEAYGYSHFAILTLPASDDARAELKVVRCNWSPTFLKAYEKLGLLRFSPVIRALKSGPTPFAWDIETLHGLDEPTEPNAAANLLGLNGFHGGVYLPVHGMTAFHGAVAYAGSRTAIEEDEMIELQIASFAIFGILAACRFEENRRSNPLSTRERDCLKLAMLGKTSAEIGIILSLSEYTVSQYLAAATKKVNASNRTHAVAIAAQMGYLS